MGKGRWQHLDLRKPAPRAPSAPAPEPTPARPELPLDAAAALWLPYPAGSATHRAEYERVAEIARAALADDPDNPDALRLLGRALGHMQEWPEAAAALRAALVRAPGDAALRASLQTVQLALGEEPEAPTGDESGPAGEVAGAVCWVLGQNRLREQADTEAARLFEQAGILLTRSSRPEIRAERAAACFIGQAVALLLSGNWTGAQSAFSRLDPDLRHPPRGAALTRSLVEFARQLYEVAEALPLLTPAEQEEALRPLRELVLNARLHVRFYEPHVPVAMYWEKLGV